MNTQESITDKTQAFNYIRNVLFYGTENNEEVFNHAKTFFSEEEFMGTNFAPPHKVEDCFSGLARKCGIGCDCE
jgi:hypothetical protein